MSRYEDVRAVLADPRFSSRRRPVCTGGAAVVDASVPPPEPGVFLMMATANMIALGTMCLLRNPDQWQALRADPSLMDGAVRNCCAT